MFTMIHDHEHIKPKQQKTVQDRLRSKTYLKKWALKAQTEQIRGQERLQLEADIVASMVKIKTSVS